MERIIEQTVEALRQGKSILYPTDTIWGIGCDASQEAAVERLYAIKERDHSKSMLVLVSGEKWPVVSGKWSSTTGNKPTTFILPRELWEPVLGGSIAPNLPAADGSLGVRVPAHDFCQQVIARLGRPLVSTSANLSGYPSPATYADIDPELMRRVDYCVPPLSALLSGETHGSRIVKLAADGTQTIIRS